MDRIQDSGSYDMGSIPVGTTSETGVAAGQRLFSFARIPSRRSHPAFPALVSAVRLSAPFPQPSGLSGSRVLLSRLSPLGPLRQSTVAPRKQRRHFRDGNFSATKIITNSLPTTKNNTFQSFYSIFRRRAFATAPIFISYSFAQIDTAPISGRSSVEVRPALMLLDADTKKR